MTTKKKQTRKSVSMPGYVYDAFAAACETAGVPMAAQNERLVREWLATQTGEAPVAPEKPARAQKEKRVKPPKAPKLAKTRSKKPAKAKRTKPEGEPAITPPERVSEEKTETGVIYTYSDGSKFEHLDEPTEEMEAATGDGLPPGGFYTGVDLAKEPEPVAVEPEPEEDEDYIDDRMIVVEEDEFIDDGDGVAF